MRNETLNYYNQNADSFSKGTVNVDFSATQNRFLAYLVPGSKILDLGCGSGRDTKYFLNKGFAVDAVDGSQELCVLASEFTGITVKQMLFSELDAASEYDGIWACSSILHCSKAELQDVLARIERALKPKGILYTSFKHGDFEGLRNGRYFTDFTKESFEKLLQGVEGLELVEYWVSGDVRPGREEEKWLNLILKKTSSSMPKC